MGLSTPTVLFLCLLIYVVKELLLRNEDPSGVAIADILNDRAKDLHVLRKFSALNKSAEIITENTAEILMTRVRQEGSGVGQHADESRKETLGGK